MLLPQNVRWTSREDVCAQLCELISRSDQDGVQRAAIKLLAELGDARHATVLIERLAPLANDPSNNGRVLTKFICQALREFDVPLPDDLLVSLVVPHPAHVVAFEPPTPLNFDGRRGLMADCWGTWWWEASLIALLERATPDGANAVWPYLVTLSPLQRATLLADWTGHCGELLFKYWHESDRHELELSEPVRVVNGCIALKNPDRRESAAYLRSRISDISIYDLEQTGLTSLLRDDPVRWRDAARRLLLPLRDLIDLFGQARLLSYVGGVVRRAGRLRAPEYNIIPEPPELGSAYHILMSWPEAGPLATELLCSVDLDASVRLPLLKPFLKSSRSRALRWTQAAWAYAENRELVRRALRFLSTTPQGEDAPLYLRLLKSGDAEWMRFAVDGLHSLDVRDAGFLDRVQALARHEDVSLQIESLAVLADNGDAASLDALRELARNGISCRVRARATGWVAQLDPRPSFDAFLQRERVCVCDRWEEAVGAVAKAFVRRGTPEDLTAILQALLNPDFRCFDCLRAALANRSVR
jgi:HEAT repeat protein